MTNPTIKTPTKRLHVEGRASFLQVFKPRAVKPGDKEFYSLAVLFKKGYDLTALRALIRAKAEEAHGKDQSQWPEGWRSPIKPQNPKKYEGHEEGAFYINCKTETPPGLIMPDAKTYITEPGQLFSGCWVRVSVNAYNYKNTGNIGVGLGLGNVMLLRHDKPLGGGRIAPELEFEPAVSDEEMGSGQSGSNLI